MTSTERRWGIAAVIAFWAGIAGWVVTDSAQPAVTGIVVAFGCLVIAFVSATN